MPSRRHVLIGFAAFALAPSLAGAFEVRPYAAADAEAAIASGKPVVLHVYADWCPQCHAQAAVLDKLKSAGTYDDIAFYRVDFDAQKDVVAHLKCPRSTLIAYKGGKEVRRMSFGLSKAEVEDVLNAVK
jgi:thiol-disulfide isomerase/thioredoxin